MVEPGSRLAAADRCGRVRIGADVPGLIEKNVWRMPEPAALLQVKVKHLVRAGVVERVAHRRIGGEIPIGVKRGPGDGRLAAQRLHRRYRRGRQIRIEDRLGQCTPAPDSWRDLKDAPQPSPNKSCASIKGSRHYLGKILPKY